MGGYLSLQTFARRLRRGIVRLRRALGGGCAFRNGKLRAKGITEVAIYPTPIGANVHFEEASLNTSTFVGTLTRGISGATEDAAVSRGSTSIVAVRRVLSTLAKVNISGTLVRVSGVRIPVLSNDTGPCVSTV